MAGRPRKEPELSTIGGQIGAEIRRRRLKLKLTVEQAAAEADTPVPTWYKWESGQSITLERLPAIAQALGCKLRQLIPNE